MPEPYLRNFFRWVTATKESAYQCTRALIAIALLRELVLTEGICSLLKEILELFVCFSHLLVLLF